MASPNDIQLCNGIPVDHRLKRFLPSAKQKHSYGRGDHVDIIAAFGNTMVRDNRSTPTNHEVGFAAWLAMPDTTGGLVIALQQPAKTQVFTADVERVRDECKTLAYLDKSLAFVNGPGGLTTTSVFDAFPFIIEYISSRALSNEAICAYSTFISMLEAKKPEVLFACWRIRGHDRLDFSGKGPGKSNEVHRLRLSNGHVVRVVNGFHPSYVANYCPNESCFRRLFAMELCKALCEVNTAWREEKWMGELRQACQERTLQLIREKDRDGEQLNKEPGRELRGSKADNSAKIYKAYTKSFDNGLNSLKQIFDHMVSSAYKYQTSWDLYEFLVFTQNTSEGICDALLAVSEAMGQLAPGTLMPESALVELGKHISDQTLKFVKDDIPDLVQHQRGLFTNLWSSRYSASTSRGLKRGIEEITIRFIDHLTKAFWMSSTGWSYAPGLVLDAFKELAVRFEDALGREYDDHQVAVAARAAEGVAILNASFYTLSISSSQSAGSATPAANKTPAQPSSSHDYFYYGQSGHLFGEGPHSPRGQITPSKSSSSTSYNNWGETNPWASNYPNARKEIITPPRPSAPSPSGNCYTYVQSGHWYSSCSSPSRGNATTLSRTPSDDECLNCGQRGHGSRNCPRRRQGSVTPSRSTPRNRCFTCGEIGHRWKNCPNV